MEIQPCDRVHSGADPLALHVVQLTVDVLQDLGVGLIFGCVAAQ